MTTRDPSTRHGHTVLHGTSASPGGSLSRPQALALQAPSASPSWGSQPTQKLSLPIAVRPTGNRQAGFTADLLPGPGQPALLWPSGRSPGLPAHSHVPTALPRAAKGAVGPAGRHSRLQAEKVFEPGHAGVSVLVFLGDQLLLRPGHLHPVWRGRGRGPGGPRGMRRRVPVVDQLGLAEGRAVTGLAAGLPMPQGGGERGQEGPLAHSTKRAS